MPDHDVSEGTGTRSPTYYRPVGPSSTGSGDNGTRLASPPIRLAAALASPDWVPTRAQVAHLIDLALRLGREWALDEIMSRPWATAAPFDARALSAAQRQQVRRAEWDRAAGQARDGDHPGGPVKAW